MFSDRSVQDSTEFRRILALPKRAWDPSISEPLTDALRTPDGTMTLRPVQAQALCEIGTQGGAFLPIRVGGGKTLISLLSAYILESRRPLLILPAALIEKTERERHLLSKHWRIPRNVRFYSYEMLGRTGSAEFLSHYRPDLIIADECHRLKNRKAAVTRRVARYMREHPDTKFVGMSGTVMKDSLHDFAHICSWSLKEGAPVPRNEADVGEWADCLDERVNPLNRVRPGVLLQFSSVGEGDPLTRARNGFRDRMNATAGVVSSQKDDAVSCSLYVTGHLLDVNPVTEANFQKLRTMWLTPDDWPISEAVILWKHARELALGFHLIWDPRPPDDWYQARRAWCHFVRDVLSRSKTLDSELQVANAFPDEPTLTEWRRLKPTFTPNVVPVWHDDSALKWCESWLSKNEGIVWCEHTFFAEELSRRTGVSYYGAGGQDKNGRSVEDGKGPIIASIQANGTGRNLQRWNRNLVTSWPGGAQQCEQLLGRTHRPGQEADEVSVDVLLGCWEHLDGFEKSQAGALAARDTLGADQKLLIADITMPRVDSRDFRWRKVT